ncbi:hypothetical protein TorRG33x02_067360 [Trema orientale]|uniref:DUF4283 domain-containing protein n=1 Tax=Trema orientale TaxID=63057 RepID=A0A2P5FID5_TREOI|nr:hypothetical protein TorRG33x02_067360 [Trema orientale]
MDDIVEKWSALSISEKDKGVLDESLLTRGADDLQLGLIGRVFSKKSFNRGVFKEVMARAWKVENGLDIKETGPDTFVFSFGHEIHKRRKVWDVSSATRSGDVLQLIRTRTDVVGGDIFGFSVIRYVARECYSHEAQQQIASGKFCYRKWLKASKLYGSERSTLLMGNLGESGRVSTGMTFTRPNVLPSVKLSPQISAVVDAVVEEGPRSGLITFGPKPSFDPLNKDANLCPPSSTPSVGEFIIGSNGPLGLNIPKDKEVALNNTAVGIAFVFGSGRDKDGGPK